MTTHAEESTTKKQSLIDSLIAQVLETVGNINIKDKVIDKLVAAESDRKVNLITEGIYRLQALREKYNSHLEYDQTLGFSKEPDGTRVAIQSYSRDRHGMLEKFENQIKDVETHLEYALHGDWNACELRTILEKLRSEYGYATSVSL